MSLWAAGQNRAPGETRLVSLGRGRGLEKTEGAGHSRQSAGEEGEPKAVDAAPRGFAWVLICFLDQVLKIGRASLQTAVAAVGTARMWRAHNNRALGPHADSKTSTGGLPWWSWLSLSPNAGGLGVILGLGTGSHVPQLRPCTAE